MSAATESQAGGRPAGPVVPAELPPVLRTHEAAVGAARSVAAVAAPGASQRDQHGGVPWEPLAALDASGLLSILLPSSLDGPELGAATLAEVIRILAVADPAVAQTPQAHYLFTQVAWEVGSSSARARLAQTVLAGGRVGNAVAERGGSHAQDLRVRLQAGDGDQLALSGTKYYATGAISSALIAVTALGEGEQQQLVFIERDAPGVELSADWTAMGQKGTVSGSVRFDEAPIDPELVVPYWEVFESPQTFGARAQLIHAAIEVGIARGALGEARRFVRETARPFAEAVKAGVAERAADDPHVVHRYGQLDTRVTAAEALLAQAAGVLDEIPLRPDDPQLAAEASLAVARAKAFGSDVAVETSSELFALSGASAADDRHNLHRHWRNARTHSIHDPVAWKYHHIGAYELGDVLPPNHGQL